MIRFLCSCGKKIKVDDKYAGKNGKCPHCGNLIKIPKPQKADEPRMKQVVCGKCKHKQDVPEALANKIFICEKCGGSTLPHSKEQAMPSLKIDRVESYSTDNYLEGFSDTPSISQHYASSQPKRSACKNREFVPERFSKYLSHTEGIKYASNSSLTSLILRLIVPVLTLVGGLVSVFSVPNQNRFEGYSAMIISVIVVPLIFIVILIFSWRFTYYIVTDKKVFSSSGVFNRRVTIIPLANVHTISINTGIIDSLLGLNSIVFSSAGTGGAGFIFRCFPFMTHGTVVFKYVDGAPEICRFISE